MIQVNLTEKETNLLKLFLDNEQPLALKQLMLSLDVSDKTLRSMVRKINVSLRQFAAEIELIRGRGYVLEGGDKPAIKRAAEEAGASEQALAVQVFRLMIDLPGYVTMENISERFYISKSKLNGVLGKMKEQMKPFGLTLKAKPHHGMRIAGEELGKRLAIASLLHEDQYLRPCEFQAVERIVVGEFQARSIRCSDIVLENLIFHIKIMLRRCAIGHVILLERSGGYEDNPDFHLTDAILGGLERELKLTLPVSEKTYLYSYLIGQISSIKQDTLKDTRVKIEMIIDAFLQKIEQVYDVSLWDDSRLRSGLVFHLEPLIGRLHNDVHLKNPILREIKQQFPFAFNLAVLLAEEIQRIYQKKLIDDDIAYLTMHIGLALERDVQRGNIHFDRIAIVCTTGQGTAELLKFKIEHTFPNAHYVKTFSLFNKEEVVKFVPDIVFSTVPVEIGGIPVEIISPFFTDEDKAKLTVYQKRREKERLIGRYFSEDLFYGALSAGTKHEAIHKMCARIAETGITPPDFEELCLIRENLGSTAFGNLIALVHPIELCSAVTKVGVGILKKQIDWEGVPVKVVFVIAQAKSSEARDLLLLIQEIVHDSSLMIRLCEAESFGEFKRILLKDAGR
ncbi:transcription antiterminator [Paenibacillus oralis]|uniref:Transcription antiterminator n=1 Tax=Paenibacillus oralis TaxID=2490856 RepID=A0A3P3U9B6_9BACL|nr:BglG family transcription antiterminator [Paenibacillus oralis]RRJ65053.1 transcription antiterminator [Paenibacillus oralis]